MLIKDLADKITEEDIELLNKLFRRKFFKEEQEEIINIFERYTGVKTSRSCGKCRSETLYKVQRVLQIINNK